MNSLSTEPGALSLRAAHHYARRFLEEAGMKEAVIEAKILVEWVSQKRPIDVLLRPDVLLPKEAQRKLENALMLRRQGVPIYRLIGAREFYGHRLALNKDTLDPRPDTEILVDLAQERFFLQNEAPLTLLDIGTGSGAIAISLLSLFKNAQALAVDISENALRLAYQNAVAAGVERRFIPRLSDCFERVKGSFDLIISNPPYIPHDQIPHLMPEVRDYDPIRALDGGKDGLHFYRILAKQSRPYLKVQGLIAIEIGQGQEDDVRAIFAQQGFRCLEVRPDLNRIPRAILFQ
ncbi:peptide chain release factor N(5)-glutamine methyltransferase [Bartonella sp. DGB2]|uniref:peptide chain release factor N(5)-glutamine methyltransferase n=1 Tax=Bartonella sp. DGB2 TaxID=3388426 RepID=UPI00398F8F4D